MSEPSPSSVISQATSVVLETSALPEETSTPLPTTPTETSTSALPTETSAPPTETPTTESESESETSTSPPSETPSSTSSETPSPTPPPETETLTTPTPEPSSTPPPVPTSFSLELSVEPGGITHTQTRIVFGSATSVPSQTASALPASAPKSFFDNKGAVAGTFAAVGVIVLAIVFVLVTGVVRRRRAKKFDDDVEEAARDAAATARPPGLDDDASYGSGLGGGYPYSDNSHGTYGQPPLDAYGNNHYAGGGEQYGMSEIPTYGDNGYPPSVHSAGMAGMGANYQPGLGEHSSPYPAFVAAGDAGAAAAACSDGSAPQRRPSYHNTATGVGTIRQRTPGGSGDFALLEAAGLGGAVAGRAPPSPDYNRGYEDRSVNVDISRGPSQHTPNLARNKSLAHSLSAETYESGPPVQESYASNYQPSGAAVQRSKSTTLAPAADGYGGMDPYGGIDQPNPYVVSGRSTPESDDGYPEDTHPRTLAHEPSRASFRDEEDYEIERTRRTLKVANE